MPPKMLSFALICPDLPSVSERLFCPKLCHENPKRGKIRQIDAVVSSKNVVEIEVVTTKNLYKIQTQSNNIRFHFFLNGLL